MDFLRDRQTWKHYKVVQKQDQSAQSGVFCREEGVIPAIKSSDLLLTFISNSSLIEVFEEQLRHKKVSQFISSSRLIFVKIQMESRHIFIKI